MAKSHSRTPGSTAVTPSHSSRAWLALKMVFSPNNVALAAPLIMMAFLGWQRRWISDDGWINQRVVQQVFAGHGPVYNVGERVEVTTSTLWLWILLLGGKIAPGLENSIWAAAVGWLLTLLGMAAATLGAICLHRHHRGLHPQRGGPISWLPLGTLAVAALPPFWDFATSGLETGLTFAWLGVVFWLLARRLQIGGAKLRPAYLPVLPAFLIGLGPLIRPDLTLYAALFAVALLAQSRLSPLSWLGALLLAVPVPLGYEVWRMGYFGIIVPNTALAKDAGNARWDQGLLYLIDYAGLYSILAPVLVALVAAWVHLLPAIRARGGRRRLRHGINLGLVATIGAPLLAALIHTLYIVRVGGDFMHARFLLPATFAAMMPAAAIGVNRQWRSVGLTAVAFLTGWAIAIASGTRTAYLLDPISGVSNERKFWTNTTSTGDTMELKDWSNTAGFRRGQMSSSDLASGWSYYDNGGARVPTVTGSGVVITTPNIGMIGVAAGPDVLVVDPLALGDGITSHAQLDSRLHDSARVGHSARPDAWRTARYAQPSSGDDHDVVNARAALRCGELAELQHAITAPITPDQFWWNVKNAPRLTSFTFPADPFQARKDLCGWQPGF